MRRRDFFNGIAGAAVTGRAAATGDFCGCAFAPQTARPGWRGRIRRARIQGAPQQRQVLRRDLEKGSDRPYVFVKLETNEGLIGWGEATLEGKAGAVIECIQDFRELLIGADPVQVEHIWQSMYIHSFYRAGPVMGSAIAGIDQALWDLRGKILGMPVYKMLGGPFDQRGVRGYYHARAGTMEQLRRFAGAGGRTRCNGGEDRHPGSIRVDRDRRENHERREGYRENAGGPRTGHRHRGRLPREDKPQRGGDHRPGSRAIEFDVRRGTVPAGKHSRRWHGSRNALPRR